MPINCSDYCSKQSMRVIERVGRCRDLVTRDKDKMAGLSASARETECWIRTFVRINGDKARQRGEVASATERVNDPLEGRMSAPRRGRRIYSG